MNKEGFTVWVAQYALTKGILKLEVRESYDPAMLYHPGGNGKESSMFRADECFRTEVGALRRAEQMRLAKIGSLTRQLEKLQKLDFKAVETE